MTWEIQWVKVLVTVAIQTDRVLRTRAPAMEGPTPAMETPRILRVDDICIPDVSGVLLLLKIFS